ncbi:MAG TPA: superoxide dismutase family protein [Ureibacillus sp.]|nr:superoxide dismutase family protein [Ureibacillus sp.]
MWKNIIAIGSLTFLLSGCGFFGMSDEDEQLPVAAPVALKAAAIIEDTEGNEIGNMELTEGSEGVLISLGLTKLSEGEHGIHIHEVGKCEKPKFESAGAHFNPLGKMHGMENPKGPHLGDLPNISPEEDGTVQVEFIAKNLTLEPGMENSLLDKDGTAIVIHEDPDDYKTDPAGNSGSRIACGVIKSVE